MLGYFVLIIINIDFVILKNIAYFKLVLKNLLSNFIKIKQLNKNNCYIECKKNCSVFLHKEWINNFRLIMHKIKYCFLKKINIFEIFLDKAERALKEYILTFFYDEYFFRKLWLNIEFHAAYEMNIYIFLNNQK